jgi:putative endonuclease
MRRRYFVYILANRPKGVLYVGVTSDLPQRTWQHRTKAVAGFTKRYGVVSLVYYEEHASILEAQRPRACVKALAQKLEVSADPKRESNLA